MNSYFSKTNVWGDFAKFRLSGVRANSKTKGVDLLLKNAFETHGMEIIVYFFFNKNMIIFMIFGFLLKRSLNIYIKIISDFFLKNYGYFHDFCSFIQDIIIVKI